MTGTEALTRLESIGARVLLLPGDALDVTYPPEAEALVAELAAHKPEAVAVLRARPLAPHLPGRAERPCLACGRECRENELFHDEACFEAWKARRRLSTSPRVTRTASSPARNTPRETSPDGSAA